MNSTRKEEKLGKAIVEIVWGDEIQKFVGDVIWYKKHITKVAGKDH